jgi:hypothetical protein
MYRRLGVLKLPRTDVSPLKVQVTVSGRAVAEMGFGRSGLTHRPCKYMSWERTRPLLRNS